MKKYYSHVRATAFSAIKESLVKYMDEKYESLELSDHIDLNNMKMVDFYLFHIIHTDQQVFFRDILNKSIPDKEEQELFKTYFNKVTVMEDIIEILLIFKLINNDKNLYDKSFIDTSFRSILITQVQEIRELFHAANNSKEDTSSEEEYSTNDKTIVMERPKRSIDHSTGLKLISKNALLNCVRIVKTSMDSEYYD